MTTETAGYGIDQNLIHRMNEQRQAEIIDAIDGDRHYWITTLMFRVSNPRLQGEIHLDAENMRGLLPIHCAICGTDDTESTTCTDESTAG